MGEIYGIIVKSEVICKRQSIIVSSCSFYKLSSISVFTVDNVITISMPSYSIFRFLLRVNQNFHSFVVKGVWLIQIKDVKFY